MTSFTQVSNSNTHNRDCMKLARFKTARDSKQNVIQPLNHKEALTQIDISKWKTFRYFSWTQ